MVAGWLGRQADGSLALPIPHPKSERQNKYLDPTVLFLEVAGSFIMRTRDPSLADIPSGLSTGIWIVRQVSLERSDQIVRRQN